jgi:hypothetical protein
MLPLALLVKLPVSMSCSLPSTASLATSTVDRCSSSCQPDTTPASVASSKHRCIPFQLSALLCARDCASSDSPQHVRHNEQPYVRASDVDPIQVGDSAVALCDVDILHLYIHVVLSCEAVLVVRTFPLRLIIALRRVRTFDKLATVGLSGCDLHCHLVALGYVRQLRKSCKHKADIVNGCQGCTYSCFVQ